MDYKDYTAITPHSTVLVLNASYEPINLTQWKRAVLLLMKNKAVVISHNVIRLVNFVKISFSKISFAYPTRDLIYKRDGHTCQYCGAKENLTLDHIIPSSRGGTNDWDNLTTSCKPCNLRKGSKLLEDTDMKLMSQPSKPWNKISLIVSSSNNTEWKQYLYV